MNQGRGLQRDSAALVTKVAGSQTSQLVVDPLEKSRLRLTSLPATP